MKALYASSVRPANILGVVRAPERLIFGVPLAVSVLGLIVGGAALTANAADAFAVPVASLMGVGLLAALVYRRRRTGAWNLAGMLLVGLCLAASVLLLQWPEYLYGSQINGIVHRSLLAGPLLLLLSALTASYAIRWALGASPTGQDLSLYPLITLPVVLALVAYGLILWRVVESGVGGLSLELLTTEYRPLDELTGEYIRQAGLKNQILGTVLLTAMTSLIALLPGVGAGVFMSEYPGRLAHLIGFCTTMLRAMSVFIIGATAFGFVGLVPGEGGTLLSDLIRGSYLDKGGAQFVANGSFLTASLFLALLVIPIIAKLTEEGLRSVPRDIREGTVALGATEGYGLRRILLPWAGPNIVTGLLLGAAEATGSLAILMFIAGTGEHDVSPLGPVTSLDVALFQSRYGTQQVFKDTMLEYQFTAALLLLFLTLGLTVLAIFLRQRFGRRYRGSLVAT